LTARLPGLLLEVPFMHTMKRTSLRPAFAAALLQATAAASLTAATGADLEATKAGDNLILAFPTASPELYTVQTSPDLLQAWTNLPAGIAGDGSVKLVTVSNAIPGGQGFYRLLIRTPVRLSLPQPNAFAILGHSCGGIREETYATGFDPATGLPTGEVYLSTTCSTGGLGSRPATFTAWAAVTWDFAGTVVSSTVLSNAVTVSPTFIAADGYGDTIYNLGAAAYVVVPVPAAPTGVSAAQVGDQFVVAWAPNGVNPAAVTSSILTATPVNSTAPLLTTTVTGSAMTGVVPTLQPATTYQVTVVNTTIGGPSPASSPLLVTTVPASVPPSAPAGVTAAWTVLDPTGTNDTLVTTWQAAVAGDSPIDLYQVTIAGSDGAGTLTQTVSGTTLTASFTVDYIPNWSVTVQAHNASGWGPWSSAFRLGGL
jgi:Fibronectin type III domain